MEQNLQIIIFSVCGASLFFAAGYLWAKLFSKPDNSVNLAEVNHSAINYPEQIMIQPAYKTDAHIFQKDRLKHHQEEVPLKKSQEGVQVKQKDFSPQGSKSNIEQKDKEIKRLQEQIEDLKKQNTSLRSLGLVYEAAPQPVFEEPESLEDLLESLLQRLSFKCEGIRGGALADKQGRKLAGTGPHADGLAIFGAIFNELSKKVPNMAPLTTVQELTIVGEKMGKHEVRLMVRPVSVSDVQVFLIFLFIGQAPDSETLYQVINEVSKRLS